MVADGGANHLGPLAVAFQQVGADFRVAALGLVVGGLADVVQQAAAPGEPCRQSPISSANMPAMKATSMLWRRTFWL